MQSFHLSQQHKSTPPHSLCTRSFNKHTTAPVTRLPVSKPPPPARSCRAPLLVSSCAHEAPSIWRPTSVLLRFAGLVGAPGTKKEGKDRRWERGCRWKLKCEDERKEINVERCKGKKAQLHLPLTQQTCLYLTHNHVQAQFRPTYAQPDTPKLTCNTFPSIPTSCDMSG